MAPCDNGPKLDRATNRSLGSIKRDNIPRQQAPESVATTLLIEHRHPIKRFAWPTARASEAH